MSLAQNYLSKSRGRLYCIFMDFSKAFDIIGHDKLWDALQRKGIRAKYCKCKSCVSRKDNFRKFFDCMIGTKEGCVESPQPFSLFINYFISCLNKLMNLAYLFQMILKIQVFYYLPTMYLV